MAFEHFRKSLHVFFGINVFIPNTQWRSVLPVFACNCKIAYTKTDTYVLGAGEELRDTLPIVRSVLSSLACTFDDKKEEKKKGKRYTDHTDIFCIIPIG